MIRAFACILALALAAPAAGLAAPEPQVSVTVKDLTPKFLAFYDKARKEKDPDKRFALWKQMYGFAAVPPGPQGEAMARGLLDHAWSGYPAVMERIKAGLAGFDPPPETTLRRVAAVLKPDQPVKLELLLYVGGLEKNAFAAPGKDGVPTVAVSVEADPAERGPVMTHEMVHAVQIDMGAMSGAWIRTIGETVLAEGLATRVTQHLYPALPERTFIEREPGWLEQCAARRREILLDVKSALASSGSEDVFRYTIGKGPAGVEREAYYAGWLVVDYWTRHGLTYAEIARIPEAQAPARVSAAIDGLLSEGF